MALLVAFDGTGCTKEGGEAETSNVVKFSDAYDDDDKIYLPGIGTTGTRIIKGISATFGKGGRPLIAEALEKIDADNVSEEEAASRVADVTQQEELAQDDLDVIGYSRGAALALHFANEVKRRNNRSVRFLGLWDTVPSFGIPNYAKNEGWNLTLPAGVGACYHAMAIHERRGAFAVTRVEGATEEVWFRGVHSDVGGAGNLELSSISLCWMLRHAEGKGLPIQVAKIVKHEGKRKPGGKLSENFDPIKDPWRTIEQGDHLHKSVLPSGGAPMSEYKKLLASIGIQPNDVKEADPVD
jgi:hypothetical protein